MKQGLNNSVVRRIEFIGSYLPRRCGIARFTTDLCKGIAAGHSNTARNAVPVNDIEAR